MGEMTPQELLQDIARRLVAEVWKATNAPPETVTAQELDLLKGEHDGQPVS